MEQLQTIVSKYWKEPDVALTIRTRWHDILALKEKHCDFFYHTNMLVFTSNKFTQSMLPWRVLCVCAT